MRKKITLILCLLLIFFSFSFNLTIHAANKCKITIGKVDGNIGDTVYVPISIKNNPGISGISFSVTYNSNALKYNDYIRGTVFSDSFMLKDHPEKNEIRIVLVETYKDSINNGDIITLKFNIADNAKTGFYKIGIDYSNGDFANRKLEAIMPEIAVGGVNVYYNELRDNCDHEKFSNYKTIVNPTCKTKGIKEKECLTCGKKIAEEINKTDHYWESAWQIDTPATKESNGDMTRHCKYCTSRVDRITFTLEDAKKAKIENTVGSIVPKNDFTLGLFKEQNPNSQITQNSIPSSVNSSNSNVSSATSQLDEFISKPTTSADSTTKVETPYEESLSSKTESSKTETPHNSKTLFIILMVTIIILLFSVMLVIIFNKPKN